jgi:hypothetical protein
VRINDFEDRVSRDPMLKAMVESMASVIEELVLTPTEVREAAIYACCLVEQRRKPGPVHVTMPDGREVVYEYVGPWPPESR